MELSKDELIELENFAQGFNKPREIALVFGKDPEQFVQAINTKGPIRDAYQRGLLLSKFKLNKSIVDQAIAGSTPAQTAAAKLIQELKNEGYTYV
jgi:hypothetical protein